MRRKIKHTKRYKDYPKNVPRILLKKFFAFNCSVTKLAISYNVNSGVISALFNDGVEPTDNDIRERLHLKKVAICKCCGRKIVSRAKPRPKVQSPEFLKEWKHLETAERHKVIQEYLTWKKRKKIG